MDYYDKGSTFNEPTYSLTEKSKNIGAFAQARFDLSDAWRLSAGARFDSQDFTGVDGSEFDASGASGNVSLTYFFNDNWSVRAGYSNVFGGYQLEDNYKFWDTDYAGLEPSRGENLNIGVDYNMGALSVGVEGFITKIKNARLMQWDRTTSSYTNSGADVESKGFNIGGTYEWALGSMRLTYTNADLTIDGEHTGTYEAQAFGFGTPIGQRVAFEVQQFAPTINTLFGATIDMAFDNDSTALCSSCGGLDGYTVVDVFAEYTPPSYDNVTIRASINNLFDEDYSDRGTYGQDYPDDIIPMKEPGRTFLIEAVVRF